MGRRSAGDNFMREMERPGVASLPAPEYQTYVSLILWLAKTGKHRFELGSEILTCKNILAETCKNNLDCYAHIDALIARDFFHFDADGALACTALRRDTPAAIASRNNGLAGGRPRGSVSKNADEAKRKPRQTGVVVPINGARAQQARERQVSGISHNNNNKESAIADNNEFQAVCEDVEKLIGKSLNMDLLRQWLDEGATPELIRTTIGTIMEKQAPNVNSLRYFHTAITRAIANTPPPKPKWEREWEKAHHLWAICGQQGPSPKIDEFKLKFAAGK